MVFNFIILDNLISLLEMDVDDLYTDLEKKIRKGFRLQSIR